MFCGISSASSYTMDNPYLTKANFMDKFLLHVCIHKVLPAIYSAIQTIKRIPSYLIKMGTQNHTHELRVGVLVYDKVEVFFQKI